MNATSEIPLDKVTLPSLLARKSEKRKITCLTAADFPLARLIDEAGIDLILVGDSLAMTRLGYSTTVPVSMTEMLVHLRAVRRAVRRAFLVADMPFGSYHVSQKIAMQNAIRLVKEGGAEAVKLEGGRRRARLVQRLVEAEIPVMGHIGLTPQSVHALGGYKVQGKTPEQAQELIDDAQTLQEIGVFSIVLEGIPQELAQEITASLRIPTIGIGAGSACDGQILVSEDLLGLSFTRKPKFVRQYANLQEIIGAALRHYAEDCRNGTFPSPAESYSIAQSKSSRT
ncbi:MAG: 3-methyl-2-oxobutanoate hydroxymethyltransferase [Terriglobia bacterium]